jgi:hypothetical protein
VIPKYVFIVVVAKVTRSTREDTRSHHLRRLLPSEDEWSHYLHWLRLPNACALQCSVVASFDYCHCCSRDDVVVAWHM